VIIAACFPFILKQEWPSQLMSIVLYTCFTITQAVCRVNLNRDGVWQLVIASRDWVGGSNLYPVQFMDCFVVPTGRPDIIGSAMTTGVSKRSHKGLCRLLANRAIDCYHRRIKTLTFLTNDTKSGNFNSD
jgi:hypothetical protein